MRPRQDLLMTTLTDLANAALAYLGDSAITDISDTTSKPARLCNQFAQRAIDEVLRLGRWNKATKRKALVADAAAPAFGYTYQYKLPTDFLRMMEVNGEEWQDSSEFYEIEDDRLLSDEDTAEIRYIARIEIGQADALMQEAIALRLGMKIAIPLTGSAEMQAAVVAMFQKALAEARHADAIEAGGREKSAWTRIFGRSRLLRARTWRRDPLRLEDYP